MIQLDGHIYESMATQILESLGNSSYYKSTIDVESTDESFSVTASLSLIFFTSTSKEEWGEETTITDVVPIWTECHTTNDDGEVINNFKFETLREYLLN